MLGQAPGILLTYFAEAVLITLLGSVVLLRWYRGAVMRGMRAQPVAAAAAFAPTDQASTVVPTDPAAILASSRTRSRIRLILVYGMAGCVAAAVLAKLFLVVLGGPSNGLRAFVTWYIYCWPLVPTYVALLALPRKSALWLLAGYVAVGAAIVLAWSLVSLLITPEAQSAPLGNVLSYLAFLALEATVPFLIVVVVSSKPLRSVSAFLLAGLLVFSFSNLAVTHWLALSLDYPALSLVLPWLGAGMYLVSWYMLAALPIGYLCWRLLGWLSRVHERKGFSDVQLVVDSWWLISVFFVMSSLASDLGWGALAALLALVAYRAIVTLGLRLAPTRSTGGRRLLLLRVFGFQRRTERLFDGIAQRWRLLGSVRLIAAADLATRIVDPADVIAFVGGRMRERFVAGEADLGRHLMRMDDGADPDGRFRVNKFFCHDDTWQPLLGALLERSDAVLFDLRGFSPANSGCRYELGELSRTGLLPRTVMVVDESTDLDHLQAVLAIAVPGSGPAGIAGEPGGMAPIERIRPRSASDMERVRRRLAEVAGMRS